MSRPWLTIVSVVRDDPHGLQRTLNSVRAQALDGVDVLVVDSSDDRMSAPILGSGLARTIWVEPEGVYPAMNVGLAEALGVYVYFLNAGDLLHSSDVLSVLRAAVLERDPGWLFGRVEIISTQDSTVITPAWDYKREQRAAFSRGKFPPHQATVARTALLREVGGFDVSYRIGADYAAFLRMSLVAEPLVTKEVLANFHEGGLSTVRWQESFREFHRARREILRPTGSAALRESFNTAWHFAKVFAYREVALKARR